MPWSDQGAPHQHHRHPGPRRLHDRGRALAARARRRDPGAVRRRRRAVAVATPSTARCAATRFRASRSSTSSTAPARTRSASRDQLREKLKLQPGHDPDPDRPRGQARGRRRPDRDEGATTSTATTARRSSEDAIPADIAGRGQGARARRCSTRSRCSPTSSPRRSSRSKVTAGADPQGASARRRIALKLHARCSWARPTRTRACSSCSTASARYLPEPREVENIGARPRQGRGAGRPRVAIPTTPLVMLAFKLEDGRYGQLTYIRVYQGTLAQGRLHRQRRATARRLKVGRLVRMHSDDNGRHHRRRRRRHRARCSASTATRATRSPTARVNVRDDVDVRARRRSSRVAIKPKDITAPRSTCRRRSTASRRKTRRSSAGVDPESSETIIAGMGELHLDVYIERMKREYKAEVVTVAAAGRVPRDDHAARPSSTTRTRSRPVARASTASVGGYVEPFEGDFEFVDEINGGAIPREFIPSVREGLQVDDRRRAALIGVPGRRRPRRRSTTAQSHAVDSSRHRVPGSRARRVPRRSIPRAKPEDPRADHEGLGRGSGRVPGQHRSALIMQRRGIVIGSTEEDGIARVDAEVPLAEMFGFSTAAPLGDAGQGRVHDGVLALRAGARARSPRSWSRSTAKSRRKRARSEGAHVSQGSQRTQPACGSSRTRSTADSAAATSASSLARRGVGKTAFLVGDRARRPAARPAGPAHLARARGRSRARLLRHRLRRPRRTATQLERTRARRAPRSTGSAASASTRRVPFDAKRLREALALEAEIGPAPGAGRGRRARRRPAHARRTRRVVRGGARRGRRGLDDRDAGSERIAALPTELAAFERCFGVILAMEPADGRIALRALKEHDNPTSTRCTSRSIPEDAAADPVLDEVPSSRPRQPPLSERRTSVVDHLDAVRPRRTLPRIAFLATVFAARAFGAACFTALLRRGLARRGRATCFGAASTSAGDFTSSWRPSLAPCGAPNVRADGTTLSSSLPVDPEGRRACRATARAAHALLAQEAELLGDLRDLGALAPAILPSAAATA